MRATLAELVDFDYLNACHTRLTVGAVNVGTGEMRYFDSRPEIIEIDHNMASGALPPVLPALPIDGESYWDGAIFSNAPVESVFDHRPRRTSVIFYDQPGKPWVLWSIVPDDSGRT